MPPRVELRGVWKRFRRRRGAALDLGAALAGLVGARARPDPSVSWALREVSLAAEGGECLGVIGPNGAGKSTLLRIIAGIFPPTRGSVLARGRVAPMLDLGVGFHPELTGRESVYLSTSLHGLSRRRTDAVFDEIAAFADIGDVLDAPVKEYSRGMYVRLGFSVAVHLAPDILLIDEVLAVGDEQFRAKGVRRMLELRERGAALVLASHDMDVVERICDRVCLLARGRLEAHGEPAETVARYRALAERSGPAGVGPPARARVPDAPLDVHPSDRGVAPFA